MCSRHKGPEQLTAVSELPNEPLKFVAKKDQKPRVMLVNYGWPTGVLELGSVLKHKGAADVVVFRLEETKLKTGEERGYYRTFIEAILMRHKIPNETLNDQLCGDIERVGVRFLERLLEYQPVRVGFNANTMTVRNLPSLTRVVHAFTDAYVDVGGPVGTSSADKILEASDADFAFMGEGESTYPEFVKTVPEGRSKGIAPAQWNKMMKLPGIAYRHAGRVQINTLLRNDFGRTLLDDGVDSDGRELMPKRRVELMSLDRAYVTCDDLRIPLDYSLLENYQGGKHPYGYKIGHYSTSRGCDWGKCTFCYRFADGGMRLRPQKVVFKDLRGMDGAIESGRLPQTEFLRLGDENFLANADEDIAAFFRRWSHNPISKKNKIVIETNPRNLIKGGRFDEDRIELMKPHLGYLLFGTESTLEERQKRMNKPHKRVENDPPEGILAEVIKGLERHGIKHGHFIILSDYDTTAEELVKELRKIAQMLGNTEHMRVLFNIGIALYPETPMEQDIVARAPAAMPPKDEYGISRASLRPKDEIAAKALNDSYEVLKLTRPLSLEDKCFTYLAIEHLYNNLLKETSGEHKGPPEGKERRRLDLLKKTITEARDELKRIQEGKVPS